MSDTGVRRPPARGRSVLRSLGAAAADVLAPATCVLCSGPGLHLCGQCASGLQPPADGTVDGLDRLVVLCSYEELGRDLVLSLKRRNRRGAVPLIAACLADAVVGTAALSSPSAHQAVPLVTWAPTTGNRHRNRGFDQSEVLARRVAAELGFRCRRLLRRQSCELEGASRAERLEGVAFSARHRVGPEVLLVDDVVTTGATMAAAAAALRHAGARHITGVAIARADTRPLCQL